MPAQAGIQNSCLQNESGSLLEFAPHLMRGPDYKCCNQNSHAGGLVEGICGRRNRFAAHALRTAAAFALKTVGIWCLEFICGLRLENISYLGFEIWCFQLYGPTMVLYST